MNQSSLVRAVKIQGVAVVLAFLSLTVAGVAIAESNAAQSHTKALAVCRQHAVDKASAATIIRAKLAADQNTLFSAQIKADNDFIVRLISGPVTPAQGKVIIAQFLATNQMLEGQQAELLVEKANNPVPQPPNVQCK